MFGSSRQSRSGGGSGREWARGFSKHREKVALWSEVKSTDWPPQLS